MGVYKRKHKNPDGSIVEVSIHRNDGFRKICGCGRGKWAKCPHGWHLNYQPRRGPLAGQSFRFSLDRELQQHILTRRDAEWEARTLRAAIDAGAFRRASVPVARDAAAMLEQLGEIYFQQHLNEKTHAPLGPNERYRWDLVMRTETTRTNGTTVRFGDLAAQDITRHDIDAFLEVHRQLRTVSFADKLGRVQVWHRGGLVAANRCLGRLRAIFGRAVEKEHVNQTPFRKGNGQAVKGLFVHEDGRERRLEPGEDERLLAAANPHLRALLTAALETGCRVGELLSLQWRQVRFDLNEMHLNAANTKARRARDLPMSQRLRALLDMRRHDRDGHEYPPHAYAFGDETGARVRSVKTAWANAVLKAHGIEPKREKNGKLTADCQAQLAAINLNFHDLRREAGSRMLEGGMPLNIVQQFLDHSNIATSSRYLKVTRQGMHAALKNLDKERSRCKSVASDTTRPEQPAAGVPPKSLQ